MKRGHRRVHRALWPILAIALLIGFTLALVMRPPPEKSAALRQLAIAEPCA